MSEYRGRVAHQARLAAEQKRAAAEAVALKKKQQADFITGVGTGAGMPFAMTPQMAAGQAAGMGMRFTVNQMQEAVKVAMSYETRLATLARVSGKTAEEMAELDQALVALSTQKGIAVPLGELVEFATQISKAGVSATPEILKMTETLAKLKILLPEMGAEQMSIAMVRVLKNFKLGSEHAEGFASALVRVDQESPATAQQIFNIANRLSGIAGASGASAAGVLSIAGGLAGMGNNAESASVSMGQMFTKMATDVEGFAKISGVSTEEFARAYREDPIKALQIFLTAFNKMEDTIEKAKFMESIDVKGQRSKQTMMTFAGIIDDTVARVPRLNEEMETGAALMASTGHEASKTEGSVTRLSNAFEALQKSVGNPLLGPLTGLIERLTQVTAWLERGGKAAYAFQGFLQAIPGIGNVANFLDYQSAQGQAGAGAGGAAKKLPAPPEKKVFTPPGEGLPGMPSMDLTKKQPAKGGEPAVEGVPFERQLQESLEATQKEVEKRYKTAMQAFESAKQARQHAIDLGKQFDETAREVAGAAPGEGEEKRIGAEVMRAAAGHANAASDKAKVASDQANKAFSAAQEQLKKLEQMDRERVAREGVQDVLFRGKGAVGAGIGMVRDWRKAAMQVAGEGLGLVADKLVPDKPKERLTIGRSVMDYAEKVTESVLNQDVDEAAKKTAEATTKSAIVLNDIKTLMQNGAALIQGGFAALGPP
jgi:TP901 family phage tail tape measure protein